MKREKLRLKIFGLAAKEGEKILPEMARASGRGGISALIAGTGNSAGRKGVEKAVPGESGDLENGPNTTDAGWQTAAGMALGPIAHLLMQAAPAIYNHPALLDPNNLDKSKEAAGKMMNKGIWGSLKSTFKPYAKDLMQVLDDVKNGPNGNDGLLAKAITHEQNQADAAHAAAQAIPGYPRNAPRPRGTTPVSDIEKVRDSRVRDSFGNSEGEDAATIKSFKKATEGLRPDQYGLTTIGDLDRNAKLINTDIKNGFSRADKGKGFGELDGTLSAKKNRLLDLKQAHGDVLDSALDANLSGSDTEALAEARKSYGEGRNLQDNIREFERADAGSGPDWGHAHTKERLGSKLVNKTIGTAPARTGLGVLLNQFSGEGAGSMAGRIADIRQRGNLNKPKELTPEELLKHYQEKAEPDSSATESAEPEEVPEEENPYSQAIKPAKPAQGAQNSSGNPYLDAIGQ